MRFILLVVTAVASASLAFGDDKVTQPGPTETGFLLPNGWHLTPVGKHVVTTDLPLNIIPTKDGKHVLVATSGYNKHELMVVDIAGAEPKIVSSETVRQSWYGLARDKSESKVWWSGGGYGKLHTFNCVDGKLTRTSPVEPEPKKEPRPKKTNADPPAKADPEAVEAPKTEPVGKPFASGIAIDEGRGVLYSLSINTGELNIISLKDGATKTLNVGGRPYDVLVGPNQLFISDWAGRQVFVVDPTELRVVRKVPVGEHPNQMVLHKDGRLFVACASTNNISVIDTKRGHVVETISTALFLNVGFAHRP
jgi:DNA-binding beta-propeller fold protein YncE